MIHKKITYLNHTDPSNKDLSTMTCGLFTRATFTNFLWNHDGDDYDEMKFGYLEWAKPLLAECPQLLFVVCKSSGL